MYDTVFLATGRVPLTKEVNAAAAGLELSRGGKIVTDKLERSSVEGIFAIGDVAEGRPELTPSAIAAGKMLVQRLFNGSTAPMDYHLVPTTVFTPLEYSCVGLTEEEAVAEHGEENVEVYHTYFNPLEWQLGHMNMTRKDKDKCYAKIICDRSKNERVIGLHILGPSSGEVMQGFAVAVRLGATFADFRATVGIHPTVAEEVVRMDITKRSGEDPMRTGC